MRSMNIDPIVLAGLMALAAFVGVMAGIVIERDGAKNSDAASSSRRRTASAGRACVSGRPPRN